MDHKTALDLADLPIGQISADGSCCLGEKGFVYLYKADSNGDILAMYHDRNEEKITTTAITWLQKFVDRKSILCDAIKSRYVQIIVPEKSTIIPEYFPYRIPRKSPLFEVIENTARCTRTLENCYLSAYDLLFADRYNCVRKADIHLSTYGTYRLFKGMCAAAGFKAPKLNFYGYETRETDVGVRIHPSLNSDQDLVPNFNDFDWNLDPEIITNFNPGRHVGTNLVWRSRKPLFDAKVVAFGNSFFAWGTNPTHLSYWFSRAFREFHFCWLPHFDWDYATLHRPDLLIGQTIERYLSLPPSG